MIYGVRSGDLFFPNEENPGLSLMINSKKIAPHITLFCFTSEGEEYEIPFSKLELVDDSNKHLFVEYLI